MTYANTLIAHGVDDTIAAFNSVGIKGLLIPDLPISENHIIEKAIAKTNLHSVWMVSQNLSKATVKTIVNDSSFYIYLMGYLGTTGKSIGENMKALKKTIADIHAVKDIPVAVGFGIQSRKDIEAVWEIAQGAIVGTALVRECEKGIEAAKTFLKSLV